MRRMSRRERCVRSWESEEVRVGFSEGDGEEVEGLFLGGCAVAGRERRVEDILRLVGDCGGGGVRGRIGG